MRSDTSSWNKAMRCCARAGLAVEIAAGDLSWSRPNRYRARGGHWHVPLGPTTTASMMIRSPSISNELSDLICHHEPRVARKRRVDLADEVVADLRIDVLPRARLLEGLASRP